MSNALGIARYLKSKHSYGRMHLQKLLYYSQGWSLAWTGRPLFKDQFQAYPMGPVIYGVWSLDKDGRINASDDFITDEQRAIVDAVYEFYGSHGGKALSEFTHKEYPWMAARGDLPADAPSTASLSDRHILETFAKKAMASTSAPARPRIESREADLDEVRNRARMHARRWSETLEILASR